MEELENLINSILTLTDNNQRKIIERDYDYYKEIAPNNWTKNCCELLLSNIFQQLINKSNFFKIVNMNNFEALLQLSSQKFLPTIVHPWKLLKSK